MSKSYFNIFLLHLIISAFLLSSGCYTKTKETINHKCLSASEHITIQKEKPHKTSSPPVYVIPDDDNVSAKYNIEQCGSICLPVKNL